MAEDCISLPAVDPFLYTKSGALWARHDSFFGVSSGSRLGLELVTECEFTVYTAYRSWEANLKKLLQCAGQQLKEHDPPAPSPYKNHFTAPEEENKLLLVEAEWLIASVMDSCYALTERIVATTQTLRRKSRNVIWQDIHTNPTPGGAVEANLLARFKGPSPSDEVSLIGDALGSLREWRGARTHQCHLYLHLEREPLTVVYQDTVLYGSTTPQLRFTCKELMQRFHALGLYFSWWVGTTDAYFQANSG